MNEAEKILSLINGYKISNAIFVAAENGVFEAIDGEKSVEQIAKEVSVDKKSLEIFLNVFEANGLLQKVNQGVFDFCGGMKELLQNKSPYSQASLIKLESYLAENHMNKKIMESVLRTGKGRDSFNDRNKEEQEEVYGEAMDSGNQCAAIYVGREFSSLKKGCILDLGGGAGTYSIYLSKKNPKLMVDIIDRPEMQGICNRHIKENGLQNRVKFYRMDIEEIHLEKQYDGIILSNVLHLFCEESIQKIFAGIGPYIKESGIIVLHDFFLNHDKSGPYISNLLTLDWMMQGSSFSANVEDVQRWVEPLGFQVVKESCYRNIPTRVVVAAKK